LLKGRGCSCWYDNVNVNVYRVYRGISGLGASTSVKFELKRKDLSTWDVVQQKWVVPSGEIEVRVGKSVLDAGMLKGELVS
jgi:hypothetical protein